MALLEFGGRIARLTWFSDNYKWVFDGIGVADIVGLCGYLDQLFRAISNASKTPLKAENSSVVNAGSKKAPTTFSR
jgi:hypothetical protein